MHTWVRAVCVCMCCHDNVRRGGGGAEGATCAVRPRQRRGRTLATRATHTRRDTNCPHALDRARNSVRNAVVTRCTVCVYVCQQVCQCCCPCRVGRVVSSSSWSVPPSPRIFHSRVDRTHFGRSHARRTTNITPTDEAHVLRMCRTHCRFATTDRRCEYLPVCTMKMYWIMNQSCHVTSSNSTPSRNTHTLIITSTFVTSTFFFECILIRWRCLHTVEGGRCRLVLA
jgi:hypothetical protein